MSPKTVTPLQAVFEIARFDIAEAERALSELEFATYCAALISHLQAKHLPESVAARQREDSWEATYGTQPPEVP